MKKQILFFMSALLILSSCSSNDNSDDSSIENSENFKFITQMSQDDDYSDDLMKFEYDGNGLLLSVFDDIVFDFNYNSSNKISSTYNEGVLENAQIYSGDKLIEVGYDTFSDVYSYNTKNLVESIVDSELAPDDYNNDSSYFTYDSNGDVLTSKNSEGTSIYTYEYDDKANPFYALWSKFGYVMDPEIDVYDVTYTFFKHNPTKIFHNGELLIEATYTYDADDYPVTCNYKRYYSGEVFNQGVVNYRY